MGLWTKDTPDMGVQQSHLHAWRNWSEQTENIPLSSSAFSKVHSVALKTGREPEQGISVTHALFLLS